MSRVTRLLVSRKVRLSILLILSALAGVCTAVALSGCNTLGRATVGAAHGAVEDVQTAWQGIKQGSRQAEDSVRDRDARIGRGW